MPPPLLTGQSDYGSVLSAYTSDVEALYALIKTYSEGECLVFASRVHELKGWPVIALNDPAGGRPLPVHYANKLPNGAKVDARGRYAHGLDVFIHLFHKVEKPIWTDFCAFSLSGEDRTAVDVLLTSVWGQALLA